MDEDRQDDVRAAAGTVVAESLAEILVLALQLPLRGRIPQPGDATVLLIRKRDR